jgi:hypothetical protein
MDLEVALPVGFAHDVDHHAQRAGRPFDQPAGEALIREHVPNLGEQVDA